MNKLWKILLLFLSEFCLLIVAGMVGGLITTIFFENPNIERVQNIGWMFAFLVFVLLILSVVLKVSLEKE